MYISISAHFYRNGISIKFDDSRVISYVSYTSLNVTELPTSRLIKINKSEKLFSTKD